MAATAPDDTGQLFGSAELAVEYGARVARDIASDPDYDRGAGTVLIVVDASSDAEIARQVLLPLLRRALLLQ